MRVREEIQQAVTDTLRTVEPISTAFDSIWAGANVPTQPPTYLEQIMLSHDKLYVVLAVVLIIWFGVAFFLYRTDRRLSSLERRMGDRIHEDDDDL